MSIEQLVELIDKRAQRMQLMKMQLRNAMRRAILLISRLERINTT